MMAEQRQAFPHVKQTKRGRVLEMVGQPNSMQLTALRAAADAGRQPAP
jgi:hypothetical protein